MTTATMHECAYCKQMKNGRFTRPTQTSGSSRLGAIKGMMWACYQCKKLGTVPEDPDTARKPVEFAKAVTAKVTASPISKADEKALQKDGMALMEQFKASYDIDFIHRPLKTPQEFAQASTLLSAVGDMQKTWDRKIAPMLDPAKTAMSAIKASIAAITKHHKEVADPLKMMDAMIRDRMKEFKEAEQRQLRAAQDEQRRLEEKAQALEAQIAEAASASVRRRLQTQQAAITEKLEEVAVPDVTYVEDSTTRYTPAWRLKDPAAFYRFVADNWEAMQKYVMTTTEIGKQFKEDPDVVESWPGMEKYDAPIIVRR